MNSAVAFEYYAVTHHAIESNIKLVWIIVTMQSLMWMLTVRIDE